VASQAWRSRAPAQFSTVSSLKRADPGGIDPDQYGFFEVSEQNQADEIRWAHENFGDRDQPAVEGLMAALKTHFACK